MENEHPKFLFSLIPARLPLYLTRNMHNISLLNKTHNFFKNSFFPSTIIEWNNLDPRLRKSESLSAFETNIPNFIDDLQTLFIIVIKIVIIVIKRLRLGLSHSRERKFKHSLQDTINPLAVGMMYRVRKTTYPPLPQFINERRTLQSTQGEFNYSLLENYP